MGKVWCNGFSVVDVPKSDTAKRLTMIYPYYDNPHFLRAQFAGWLAYPPDLTSKVTLIVVDDGSRFVPVDKILQTEVAPFPVRAFRIGVDVRWNWLAARNIGFHHADDGWCLVTDMDHVVPEDTLRAVLYGHHDPDVIYGFSRVEHTGTVINPHPNSWLMTRAMFWKVGGYDETLSGHYGTDGDWRRRCAKTAPLQILRDRLIRHEFVEDSSTTTYFRKQPEDAAVKRLIAKRASDWKPKTLSFPYEEVRL